MNYSVNDLYRKISTSNLNEYMGKNKSVNHVVPMVTIDVITYQQADFIKECLDGIIMQITEFPIEVVIGEDGSTDGTREICKKYAEKYPDLIRLFLRSREDLKKV